MRHYACAILYRDGRILLGRRAPHRKAYAGCWDVIGGKVEEGETLEQALHRELGEEIGVVPTGPEPLGSIVDHGPQQRGNATYHMHVVRRWTGAGPVMLDDEHTALEWFTIDQASALPDLALAEYAETFRRVG